MPTTSRPEVAVFYRGMASHGLLPGVTPGMVMSAEVDFVPIQAAAEMIWLPESSSDRGNFAFGLTAASLGACVPELRFAGGTTATCVSVLGGATHAIVRADDDLTPLKPGARAWLAVALAQRLRITIISRFVAEIGIDVTAPVTRHAFGVRAEREPIFQQAIIGISATGGLGLSIP